MEALQAATAGLREPDWGKLGGLLPLVGVVHPLKCE